MANDAFDAGARAAMAKVAAGGGGVGGQWARAGRWASRNPELVGAASGGAIAFAAGPEGDRWRHVPHGAAIGAVIGGVRARRFAGRGASHGAAGVGGPSAPVAVPGHVVT